VSGRGKRKATRNYYNNEQKLNARRSTKGAQNDRLLSKEEEKPNEEVGEDANVEMEHGEYAVETNQGKDTEEEGPVGEDEQKFSPLLQEELWESAEP
jgi:hypothetical protein